MNLRRLIYNFYVIAALLSPCINIVLAKDTPIHGPFFDCKTKVLHKSSRRYIPGWKDLTQAQAEYIESQILPVLGERTLFKDKDTLRTCAALNDCTVLDDFNSKRLRIEWDDTLDEPQIRSTQYDRILRTNTRIRLSDYPHRGSDWIYHWVMGHPLHPFTAGDDAKAARLALGEPELVYKQVQRDAIAVIDSAIRRKVKKLSWVAPTGVGKTEPLKYLLKKQLRTHGNKIHVVLADQDFLVEQLAKDIQDLRNAPDLKKHAFQIVKWGGDDKAYPLSALFKQHDDSKMPLVLVTTIQSLMGQIAESPSTYLKLLRKHMRTLVIDESHHSGANRAKLLIDEVVDHPDAHTVLFGPTATPLHEITDLESLYDSNLFYAYLDNPKTFGQSIVSTVRSRTS